MRRMKLISVFLLVSLLLLGGSVFSEEPIDEMYEPIVEETFEEDFLKKENMGARGFYREGEECGDPQFYYFASSAALSREGDEPVEEADGCPSIVSCVRGAAV